VRVFTFIFITDSKPCSYIPACNFQVKLKILICSVQGATKLLMNIELLEEDCALKCFHYLSYDGRVFQFSRWHLMPFDRKLFE